MICIPEGWFVMGSSSGQDCERPVHRVWTGAFLLAATQVTNAGFERFLNATLAPPPFRQDSNFSHPQQPVVGVSWFQALKYCEWLSAQTGRAYRLPTEAEWEKAARGTDQRKYPWGNAIDHSYANYVGASSFDTGSLVGFYDGSRRGELQTHSNASPYGAFDMAGNVMEWCQDWYSRTYYPVSPRKNPQGPDKGAYRVLRGGTFFVDALDLRSYARSAAWPRSPT